jgi:hypothetical protein
MLLKNVLFTYNFQNNSGKPVFLFYLTSFYNVLKYLFIHEHLTSEFSNALLTSPLLIISWDNVVHLLQLLNEY